MYVRKLKRKCGVRGCKNFEALAISKTREPGNSIIICRECLKDANKSVTEMKPNERSNIQKRSNGEVPGLFFNERVFGKKEENRTLDNEEERILQATEATRNEESKPVRAESNNEEAEVQEEAFKCPGCRRVFESEKGLKSHLRYCGKV